MTTDTALALLAEAEDAICILSDSIRDGTVSEYYSNLRDRITVLLDSGIKDAGDDVVEPVRDEYECYDHYVDALKDYADHLLSAYKLLCVERDDWRDVARLNKERYQRAESARDEWENKAGQYMDERDKAEAELAALRLELARLNGEIPYEN